MLSWVLGKKRTAGKRRAPAYDKAKHIAEKGNVKERIKLASYDDLDPEFLYYFAKDEAAEVAEAISATEDKSAIKALLENLTAVINEKAMIAIGTHAPDIPDWHRPLVDRDSLSEKTIRRIATFVSAALFERLIDKHGVDPDVESELRLSVRQRIESGAVPDDSLPQVLRYEPPVWLTGIDAWVWPGHEVVAMEPM